MFKKIGIILCTLITSQIYGMYKPERAGLQRQPYQLTYEEEQTARLEEALSLLSQQYWQAKREGSILPDYFFVELTNYYQQVPSEQMKIRKQFSAIQQEAQRHNAKLQAARQPGFAMPMGRNQ